MLEEAFVSTSCLPGRRAGRAARCDAAGGRARVTMVAPAKRECATVRSSTEPCASEAVAEKQKTVHIYDTTLRDGSQGEGISFTVPDKIKIAQRLDEFGVHYIEGGWPGSNPKDEAFFAQCKGLGHAKLVAFGSTRYKNSTCEKDRNVGALVRADTPVVTLVGKAWSRQVEVVLEASLEENVAMISDTVQFFKLRGKEVMLDAEHFFDGYKADSRYAMRCLRAAVQAGVDVVVLCDTNGGTLPWEIEEVTAVVASEFASVRIGIHCHNDMELAVSNSIAAVRGGASLVQGTVNGFGERSGNANLMSIVPTLELKMGYKCVGEGLAQLTKVSRYVDEVANQPHVGSRAYVGASSFAHKGGLHVAAVLKDAATYQHIEPELVGNERRILVSELSGRRNIVTKAKELGLHSGGADAEDVGEWDARAKSVLEQVKELENKGFSFEGAEASVELMLRRTRNGYRPPFELMDFSVSTGNKRVVVVQAEQAVRTAPYNDSVTQASVKLALLGPENGGEVCPTKVCFEVAEGNGPVDAVNAALQKCLLPVYAALRAVSVVDYKVRILDNASGTGAITRVVVEFEDASNGKQWRTVYAHENIIVASVNALMDGFEVAMWEQLPQCIL
eukprot:gb/GEZJ01001950.1/.p1 GENE.gb/GEZJ01001950.1/~~gb/GEZJ01001950.1/.p1  ORF type:complete len:618 (+),score=82.61 gb/GEZJ01001950.1/:221-2074(+)